MQCSNGGLHRLFPGDCALPPQHTKGNLSRLITSEQPSHIQLFAVIHQSHNSAASLEHDRIHGPNHVINRTFRWQVQALLAFLVLPSRHTRPLRLSEFKL